MTDRDATDGTTSDDYDTKLAAIVARNTPDADGYYHYDGLADAIDDIEALLVENDRLRAIEAAARAMLTAADPVCCDCGVVGEHGSEDADCLTLPLREALERPR